MDLPVAGDLGDPEDSDRRPASGESAQNDRDLEKYRYLRYPPNGEPYSVFSRQFLAGNDNPDSANPWKKFYEGTKNPDSDPNPDAMPPESLIGDGPNREGNIGAWKITRLALPWDEALELIGGEKSLDVSLPKKGGPSPEDVYKKIEVNRYGASFPPALELATLIYKKSLSDIPLKLTDALPRRPADRSMPHPELTPQELNSLDAHHLRLLIADLDTWERLVYDNDKGRPSMHSVYELQAAQGLKADGRISSEVFRPSKDNNLEAGDFVVRNEQGVAVETYDHKGVFSTWPPWANQRDHSHPFPNSYNSNPERFTKKLEMVLFQQQRVPIVDTRFADQEAIDDLTNRINSKGWRERVLWYP
jgi:hypothetical protein